MSVDTVAFDTAMARQKAEARKAWSGSGDAATETIWFAVKEKAGATEFLGYDREEAEGVVAAIVAEGREIERLKAGEKGSVVLNQTPFYGESGGQVGDIGLMLGEGCRFRVTETLKKLGDLFVHNGIVEEGELAVGAPLVLTVDHARRLAIRANHSATHLLHEALRQVLGNHVAQFGFTSYWAIARLALSESGLGCSSNMGRRIKIGFAYAKADHINSLSFHRFGLGIDSQRHRWSDL
jgi:alanyl-tRNA synthetase